MKARTNTTGRTSASEQHGNERYPEARTRRGRLSGIGVGSLLRMLKQQGLTGVDALLDSARQFSELHQAYEREFDKKFDELLPSEREPRLQPRGCQLSSVYCEIRGPFLLQRPRQKLRVKPAGALHHHIVRLLVPPPPNLLLSRPVELQHLRLLLLIETDERPDVHHRIGG